MKSKSVFLIAVSLGFGLVAAIGISQVMGRGTKTEEVKIATKPVVLAVEDLDVMTELTPDLVVVEEWPANIVPEGVAGSLKDIEHKVVRSRVGKRFPIYSKDLIDKTEAQRLPIPPGYKVIAIKVAADDHFGGLLQPGDLVDVIGVFRRSGRESSSKTFLRRVRVFSVDSRTTADPKRDPNVRGNTIVGVLLTERQAEQLALVQATAELKLAMRGQNSEDDEMVAGSDGTSLERLFGGSSSEVDRTQSETARGPSAFERFMENLARGAQASTLPGLADRVPQAPPPQGPFLMTVYSSEGPTVYRFDAKGAPVNRRDAMGELSVGQPGDSSSTTLPLDEFDGSTISFDDDDFDP